jgi:hypothetical protein
MQWIIALTYLSAAGSKLYYGGLRWFNGYTMAFHYLGIGVLHDREAAIFMASLSPRMHIVPSVLAFLFELTFVVAVLVPRVAWFYVLAGVCFHLGVYLTMEIAFFQTIVLYCVFVESLRRYWPAALRPRWAQALPDRWRAQRAFGAGVQPRPEAAAPDPLAHGGVPLNVRPGERDGDVTPAG